MSALQEPERKQGKGKRKQAWTQKVLERARRGAPDRTIIIRPDGTLIMPPPGESAPTNEENEWDSVK